MPAALHAHEMTANIKDVADKLYAAWKNNLENVMVTAFQHSQANCYVIFMRAVKL